MAAGRWMGRGDKNGVDGAAVNAMRFMLNTVEMDGVIVIGEGEKDEAPMLFNGEKLGRGAEPQVDIAVDPIDGTRLTAYGLPNAVSVVAFAERGTMYNPQHIFYMDKIATGPYAAHAINIEASPTDNIRAVARALRKSVEDVTVVVLDRPRHEELIKEIRNFLMENLDKRFTIEELSKKYLLNTSTLKAVFKAVYGQPVASYVRERRMKLAAKLLRESDASVAEIARAVGYETQGKFTKAFKESAGETPAEYRRNQKGRSR